MTHQGRREAIKRIARGAAYASPVIASLAAPARLMAQGPSGMMLMFCDYFPVLCMIFGGLQSDQPSGAPGSTGQPGQPGAPPPGGAPPTPPPPSRTNPPPGGPPPGR